MTYTIKITEQDAVKFTEEVGNIIFDRGLYAMTKTDVYDLLLHLLDTYDQQHFLSSGSNYDNARRLKVAESKVKNAKVNIAQKFYSEEKYATLLHDVIDELVNGNGRTRLAETEERYSFVMENIVQRRAIEAKLKEVTADTLDYSFNQEKVTIKKASFLAMLSHVCNEGGTGKTEELEAFLEEARTVQAIEKGFDTLKSIASGNAVDNTLDIVKELCKFALPKIQRNLKNAQRS